MLRKPIELNQIIAFNTAQGPRQSANEHLIPEALFDDPATSEKEAEAISAVKALQIAQQQGQKIFTITQANIAQALPQLSHRASVTEDVQNAINAGKVVTISQSQISYKGWTGTGYVIVDPKTGAGAYLIGGAADGGKLEIKDVYHNRFFNVLTLMPNYSWIEEDKDDLSLELMTIAHVAKLAVIKINKFYECNREAIINYSITVGICVLIAALIAGIQIGTVGLGTPAAGFLTISLISMMPMSANAAQNIMRQCQEKCMFATEENIRFVLEPTTELTVQKSVSLPAIQRYVERFEQGSTALPPIKIYENRIIVDGNHRFIVAKLCKIQPSKIAGELSLSSLSLAYPIKNINLDILDWGNF